MAEKIRQFFGVPSLGVFFTLVICVVVTVGIMAKVMEGKSFILQLLIFVALIFVIRGGGALVRYFQKNRE